MKILLFLLLGFLLGRIKKTVLTRNIIKDGWLFEKDKPYLIRWTLFSCPWFTLKLHKTLISDPEEPHDHPWNYTSLILWGGYWEVAPIPRKDMEQQNKYWQKTWYGVGSLLFRRGDKLHKLVIPEGKYCITLLLTTKKWRDWGFMRNGQWKSHKDEAYEKPPYEYMKSFTRKRLGRDDYE